MPDFALPRSRILGTGHYLPDVVRTNFDLEKMVDTTDEWIRERTGILERHIAPDGIASSDMAKIAAERALTAAGILPEDLDMIIVGTVTGDMPMPATAVFLQQQPIVYQKLVQPPGGAQPGRSRAKYQYLRGFHGEGAPISLAAPVSSSITTFSGTNGGPG